MKLTLFVEGMDDLEGGLPAKAELDEHGLVIGRSPHTQWCLPDQRVSSYHCEIDWRDGFYWLRDTDSTNGTFVNGVDLRDRPPHPIVDGDQIQAGQYRVRARLAASTKRAEPQAKPYANGIWPDERRASRPTFPDKPERFQEDDDGWGVAPGGASRAGGLGIGLGRPGLGGPGLEAPGPEAAGRNGPGRGDRSSTSSLSDLAKSRPVTPVPETPTAFEERSGGRPDPWEEFLRSNDVDRGERDPAHLQPEATTGGADEQAPQYRPSGGDPQRGPGGAEQPGLAPPAPASPSHGDLAWASFLAAAGIDPAELGVDAVEAGARAGEVMSRMIEGLMLMLHARAKAKAQMGVESTFYGTGNNPFKFVPDSHRIATLLLNPPLREFMPADEAVDNAFDDLQAHQMATLAAMQRALQSTLARFSPRAIRDNAEKRGLTRFLVGSRDAALWRAYEREFDGVAMDSNEAFLDMFAKAFRRAYEDQAL
ncbi:type VI secretion system-associated FHA domain protein TagH [Caulobacter flavus]|uniref:Type VI secretion system-associated FHA domain protein TagH n=1 Tax=Caulobacter flavus TaxID=1679497 RepID=A0A2N5CZH9_9CAUL|nr:type VI secretion system-associated FHA domain protein TagH [Caulobacter flavus]AYV45135.1 type VI secretion system-associated FHA domain protein TagH [Caulobacter flavus]PLR19185.1 type VI secretion system-associated FHA domain protein TagH [Caulobacter flavus]